MDTVSFKNIIAFFCCIICLVQEDLAYFGLLGGAEMYIYSCIRWHSPIFEQRHGFLDHQYTYVQSCIMTADCFLRLELVFHYTYSSRNEDTHAHVSPGF